MLLTEMMVDRIAAHVGKPVEVVRELNMYREGEKTHYGQVLEDCHARRCWQEVMANSDYSTRKSGVEAYNREHRWRKRGLAITPTKFASRPDTPAFFITSARPAIFCSAEKAGDASRIARSFDCFGSSAKA